MKKSNRETIYNKYGGKCAYCGCDLLKGWHVDEIEPVFRKTKTVDGNYYNKETGIVAVPRDAESSDFFQKFEYRAPRSVSDGCEYPERFHVDNQNPACASCNINKHSGSLEEFRNLIAGFMKHLNKVNTQYKIAKRYGLVIENEIQVKFYFETLSAK